MCVCGCVCVCCEVAGNWGRKRGLGESKCSKLKCVVPNKRIRVLLQGVHFAMIF